jgi:protein-S-isoprenylcysteine O-methyltransferase Ste14
VKTERTVAIAQVILSVVFIGGYFFILSSFLDGRIHTPPEWKDVLTALISLLTAGVLLILQFWFSRSRPQDPPKELT